MKTKLSKIFKFLARICGIMNILFSIVIALGGPDPGAGIAGRIFFTFLYLLIGIFLIIPNKYIWYHKIYGYFYIVISLLLFLIVLYLFRSEIHGSITKIPYYTFTFTIQFIVAALSVMFYRYENRATIIKIKNG